MSAAAANLRAGHIINSLRIESVLDEGTFGVTYCATDTSSNSKVALKEYLPMDIAARTATQAVQPRTKADAEAFVWGLKRFADEAQTLGAIAHPNIVRMQQYFECNGTGYMMMDLVTGQPLNVWGDARRPAQQQDILSIILPLLDGLSVIHEKRFVHRDIKPANIVVRDDGQPVLLDFGSARELKGADQRLTAIISPGYAPIEQYDADAIGNQGPWTDIYSVGAVMYWMVTGRRPVDAAARVHRDPLVPAASFFDADPACPFAENFLIAIDKALSPDPAGRFQSASELRRALKVFASANNAVDDLPTLREPPGLKRVGTTQAVTFPPDLLKRIEGIAIRELGPIAPMAIRQAARKCTTVLQLCTVIAGDVKDDKARAAFLQQLISGA